MKHAYLGEYYARFVPHAKKGCRCGERYQMHEHIIQSCPRYEEHRHILWKVNNQLKLGVLLVTDGGLEVMAKFLKESGAFTKTGKKCK
ncbi:hypothetical protein J132_07348 [Termitomyces sp. J132]|nr:hypothetical protein J132_07348 [Termitomyces sp. J132]